jgi:hypothetical protein
VAPTLLKTRVGAGLRETAVRILSWNLAYWKPGQFNSIANRRRQWILIGALRPDVALLQECRPPDVVRDPGCVYTGSTDAEHLLELVVRQRRIFLDVMSAMKPIGPVPTVPILLHHLAAAHPTDEPA